MWQKSFSPEFSPVVAFCRPDASYPYKNNRHPPFGVQPHLNAHRKEGEYLIMRHFCARPCNLRKKPLQDFIQNLVYSSAVCGFFSQIRRVLNQYQ
ncbi:hypothetical protein ACI0FM_05195 [Paenochrobactrum sp. BZR 588]|uniref:hypothetical protein n=1 Tax=Paenochrobactrum TaxID=999488 RepID=UPI0035BC3CF5